MNTHKRIRLTPLDRQEIWRLYQTNDWTIVTLAREFRVSRPTIYKVLERARSKEFAPRKSTNKRFLQAKYGIKRLAKLCTSQGVEQKFTKPARPQTNGKAERVIKTLMDMWHSQQCFASRKDRLISLARFINFYNTVKPHTGINNMTPYEKLTEYFEM